jgi:hypothetical protein
MKLEKAIKNRMQYYKDLKDKLEIQTKVSSLALRNQWLRDQKIANYQNEYDRIRGELSKSNLQGKTVEMLKKRKEMLEKLGAKAFNSLN